MAHNAREMEREGYDDPAADRRRHDLAHAHGGQDRAALSAARWSGCRTPRAACRCARNLLSDEQRVEYLEEVQAPSTHASRTQHERQEGPGPDAAAGGRARERVQDRLEGVRAAEAVFLGHQAPEELRPRRARRVHRLGAVLPDLGACRARIPKILDDAVVGAEARKVLRRRPGDAEEDHRGQVAHRQRGVRHLSRPTR